MNFNIFCTLLLMFGTVTTVFIEALKPVIKESKFSDKVAFVSTITGLIVGIAGTIIYMIILALPFTASNIVIAIMEGIAVSVGSQIGYDKLYSVLKSTFKTKVQ